MISLKQKWRNLKEKFQDLKSKEFLFKLKNFIKTNKGVSIVLVGSSLILVLSRTVPYQKLAKICAESSLVNICGKIIHIQDMKLLVQELQSLSHCDIALKNLHEIVEDSEMLDSEKSTHVQLILFGIQIMPNNELQTNAIVCWIELVTKLYSSDLSNFNLLIQALIDAFKKGRLSYRLFQIILRMLANRGIPIDGILEAME